MFLNNVNLFPFGCNSLNPLPGTNKNTFYSRAFNTCGFVGTTTVSADYNNQSELVKLRYRFGKEHVLHGSYFGSQSSANQSGNTASVVPSVFTPGPGYNAPLKAGTGIDVLTEPFDAQPQFETNNEPIFQAKLSSAIGNGSVIARFYHATINRVQTTGFADPFSPEPQLSNFYGTTTVSSNQFIFNGQPQALNVYSYFNEPEIDKLTGDSFQYVHPFGEKNELTFAVDTTHATSVNLFPGRLLRRLAVSARRRRRQLLRHANRHPGRRVADLHDVAPSRSGATFSEARRDGRVVRQHLHKHVSHQLHQRDDVRREHRLLDDLPPDGRPLDLEDGNAEHVFVNDWSRFRRARRDTSTIASAWNGGPSRISRRDSPPDRRSRRRSSTC